MYLLNYKADGKQRNHIGPLRNDNVNVICLINALHKVSTLSLCDRRSSYVKS